MTRRMVLAALALAGIFVALYLTLFKLGAIGELTCSVGSCEQVNTSRWSTFLGFPVAAWGVAFYLATFAVSVLGTTDRWAADPQVSRVLVGLTATGVLFSAWLTYLELFVIHAICIWCVVSAIIVTVMFVVAILDLRAAPATGQPT